MAIFNYIFHYDNIKTEIKFDDRNYYIQNRALDSKMGCCQSKLLDIQPVQAKYETNPISYNQHYLSTELADIRPQMDIINKEISDSNQCSMRGLQINLNTVIENFEEKAGKITYTNIIDNGLKTIRSARTGRTGRSCQNQKIAQEKINQQQFSVDYTPTSLNSKREENHLINSKNQIPKSIKVLQNLTLNNQDILQKHFYFTEYSEIHTVGLSIWQDSQRLPLQYTQNQCLESIVNCRPRIISVIFAIYFANMENNLKLVSYCSQKNSQRNLQRNGLKIYFNGFKRLFPIRYQGNNLAKYISQFCETIYLSNAHKIEHCLMLYHLTGWIPQTISIGQIQSVYGVFNRLANTLKSFNAIILFVNQDDQQTYILKSIDITEQTVNIFSITQLKSAHTIQSCLSTMKWSQILVHSKNLSINWNPLIYQYHTKLQSQFIMNQNQQKQYQYQFYPQFMLTIPATSTDLQVRVFIQQHLTEYTDNNKKYSLQLFEYVGERATIFEGEPIKRLQSANTRIISEIFIFEASQIANKYILVIVPQNVQNVPDYMQVQSQKNAQFSLTLYSFKQVSIKKLYPQILSVVECLNTQITQRQVGYSLISPFFLNNALYYLQTPYCESLKISISSNNNNEDGNQFIFQIMLIANQKGFKDVTLLDPNYIVAPSFLSQIFQGSGQIQLQPHSSKYILAIICYRLKQPINITINISSLDIHQKSVLNQQLITIQKIETKLNIINSKKIKWSSKNPGARIRNKSNTQKLFYDQGMFEQFFKNPYYDCLIQQGIYQFHVQSLTAEEYFKKFMKVIEKMSVSQLDSYEDKIDIKPPNISLGIFEIKKNKTKQFKIINDDQFYVPFGYGYWSKPIQLKRGQYRFVMPKLQKQPENGILQFRKISQ